MARNPFNTIILTVDTHNPNEVAIDLIAQKESSFFGVYLLISNDCVYVGETTNYASRIRNHLKEKTWWNRVVFLTTTDDNLNESHIKFIESVLIEKERNNEKLDNDNSKSGNKTNVRRNDMIMLNNYLEHILSLLEFINVDVFSDKQTNNITYYRMVNKNVALIQPNTVSEYLVKKGIEVGKVGADCSYAKLSADGKRYAIDPSVELLKRDWTIVLNNYIKNEIIILNVPKKDIIEFGLDNFKKKDETHKRVRIKIEDFTDASGFDYSKIYYQKSIIC